MKTWPRPGFFSVPVSVFYSTFGPESRTRLTLRHSYSTLGAESRIKDGGIPAKLNMPAITAGKWGKLLSITATPAQNALDRVNDAGVLLEVTGQKRNRVYMAREIVRVIDEDKPAP